MKSKIFKSMAIAVVAIFAGYNVYLAQSKMNDEISDLLVANVEALSQNEEGGGEAIIVCSAKCNDGVGKCWTKSNPYRCVFSGSQYDSCHTGMDGGRVCIKIDGTQYN